ncbi:TetR/AcrR family transcriptional regulator [Frankia sp. AgB1.9]|uniref:TetR/AcrR family transcriptional regulator n=1 Tax=unclassified Frankia TaxID=2632575 RepID=UPI0019319CA4|nr:MULTISPECIES: TetR/AcrR family transcriptional regulator [unclassified Frankia]MBL7487276.1 TetR/AcrR family transcriptional regulator [Frankia sp. AgW1.1]MBL7546283.1 TetR/AcrR family transcriptional regulator [Frankia sp. AgB1.9]MBL7618672.1 TetR/AcrR family transcriptional regulator [Frankia sp. AgB1.8]
MSELTLRDRTRAKRRAAVVRSALRLFAEQGYESTPIAQIADDAEVSPRTVSLYFASKRDLALAYQADAAKRFNETLAEREDGDTTLDVFRRWLEDEIGTHGEVRSLHRAMVRANPTLRGAQSAESLEGRRGTVLSLARDLGRSPDDVVVALVGGAMDGVLGALSEIRPDEVDPREALEVAERMLLALTDSARAETGDRAGRKKPSPRER